VASPTTSARSVKDKPVTKTTLAEEVFLKAQSGRSVVQEFTPLAESLEWELGQQYLRDRGNQAFLGDAMPVPFVINNDGTLSHNAAEVFFASLTAADKEGTLEPDIFVLELGIGVGLFARYFLDAFRDLCHKNGKDYYDRLCYIAADKSEQMLRDACRYGVFANHPGRYRLRQVDALFPGEHLPHDVMFVGKPGRPLRAVFLNYLLDCLPAAVLEFAGDEIKQLCVRTCVARNVKLEDFTELSAKALAERAKTGDAAAKRDLLEVYGLFASEYDYRPVDLKTLPLSDFALEFGRPRTKRLLHSYGAIQSLERLLELVHEQGFILVNDYGQTQSQLDEEFEHQRFSLATFVGVNFPELRTYFGEKKQHRWVEPFGGEEGIHSRLLSQRPHQETVGRFQDCFGRVAQDRRLEPLMKARMCAQVGRFEMSADFYRQAIVKQPYNWVLLNEAAMFLIFSLRDVKAGIDLAKVGLAQNPTCSSELWNTLGDGLFEYGRIAEARSAYQRALAINPADVRSRYNLIWVHQREKNFPAALEMASEALTQDKMGQYRERILQKQAEVLTGSAIRNQQEYLLLVNLVSKYANKDDKDKPKPEAAETQRPVTREP
jgi:tetratricopeptide (TPR) repeat protein